MEVTRTRAAGWIFRGAIGCNYLGLYDDEIAELWKAMIPYSHYDGVRLWGYPKSDMASLEHDSNACVIPRS